MPVVSEEPIVGVESRVFGYEFKKDGYTDSDGRDVGFYTAFQADLTLGY